MRDLVMIGPGGRQRPPRPLLRTTLGHILRRARREQGRTLADVAEAARVSMPYLSELERGRKEASSEILAAVCDALQIELSDLLAQAGRNLADERIRRALNEERARRIMERTGVLPADIPVRSGERPSDVPARTAELPADAPARTAELPADVQAAPADVPAEVKAYLGELPAGFSERAGAGDLPPVHDVPAVVPLDVPGVVPLDVWLVVPLDAARRRGIPPAGHRHGDARASLAA